jgi:hypothetical protein
VGLAFAVQRAIVTFNARITWQIEISGATSGEKFNGFASGASFDSTIFPLADAM